MSFANVGKLWRRDEFFAYLGTIKRPKWAVAVTVHHTASPSLAMRPKGLTVQHMRNIQSGYVEKGWKAGPHLFIDDTNSRCILGMTPLTEKGVHAASFNRDSIGIEVLGDFDHESPVTGRGLHAWRNAAGAIKEVLVWLKLPISGKSVRFHRDDPKTDKSCPGKLIGKEWLLSLVAQA